MANANIPILDLDSLVDRPVVLIDGKEYQLITPEILPPIDTHRLSKCGRRLDELSEQTELTEEEERELEALPARMCRLVLDAPDDVHDKLTPKHRMEVIATFLRGPRHILPPTIESPTTPASPTGAT